MLTMEFKLVLTAILLAVYIGVDIAKFRNKRKGCDHDN